MQTGQPVKIVGFGDSITGVYYHTGANLAWPELLGHKLRQRFPRSNIEIINAGISGHTSAQGLARLDADVLSHAPHLVVVMFGMNDVARATPQAYADNLRTIVRLITAHGAEVVLMTPNYVYDEDPVRPLSRLAEFVTTMREVARECGTPLADACSAYQAQHDRGPETWMRLMSDPVHPNLRGHTLFADVIIATLCNQPLVITEPPAAPASLPHLAARLRSSQPVRIVAMTPCDTLIAAALKRISPATAVELIPWDASGKSILQLEEEVRQLGWTRYRDDPRLPAPDLFVVTAPPQLGGITREQFYRAFAMILNRAQSFVPAHWDCLPILPSVLNPILSETEKEIYQLALKGVLDKGLPLIQRLPGETATAGQLFTTKLAAVLQTRVGQSS